MLDIEGFDGSLTGGRRVWGDSYNHLFHVWHQMPDATWVIVDDGADDTGAVVVRRTCEYFVQIRRKLDLLVQIYCTRQFAKSPCQR